MSIKSLLSWPKDYKSSFTFLFAWFLIACCILGYLCSAYWTLTSVHRVTELQPSAAVAPIVAEFPTYDNARRHVNIQSNLTHSELNRRQNEIDDCDLVKLHICTVTADENIAAIDPLTKLPLCRCIHFSSDDATASIIKGNDRIDIPANRDSTEGYKGRILHNPSLLSLRNGDKYCSVKKRGERAILVHVNSNIHTKKIESRSVYEWQCECTERDMFVNAADRYSLCTRYLGCNLNGARPSFDPIQGTAWSSFSDLTCDCTKASVFVPGRPPQCQLRDYFNNYTDIDEKRSDVVSSSSPLYSKYFLPFDMIDEEYVRFAFKDMETAKRLKPQGLPNPCVYDSLNNKFLEPEFLRDDLVGAAIEEDGTVYCFSHNSRITTVRYSDDYLKNNGGMYANGVVKVVYPFKSSAAPVREPYTLVEHRMYDNRTDKVSELMGWMYGRYKWAAAIRAKIPYLKVVDSETIYPFTNLNYTNDEDGHRAYINIYNAPAPPGVLARQYDEIVQHYNIPQRWMKQVHNVWLLYENGTELYHTLALTYDKIRTAAASGIHNRGVDYVFENYNYYKIDKSELTKVTDVDVMAVLKDYRKYEHTECTDRLYKALKLEDTKHPLGIQIFPSTYALTKLEDKNKFGFWANIYSAFYTGLYTFNNKGVHSLLTIDTSLMGKYIEHVRSMENTENTESKASSQLVTFKQPVVETLKVLYNSAEYDLKESDDYDELLNVNANTYKAGNIIASDSRYKYIAPHSTSLDKISILKPVFTDVA